MANEMKKILGLKTSKLLSSALKLSNNYEDKFPSTHDKNLENAIELLCSSNFKHKAFKDWQFSAGFECKIRKTVQ